MNFVNDVFSALPHGCFNFESQTLPLFFQGLLALFKGLDGLVHRVQLVQIAHGELLEALLRLLFYQLLEVLLRVLPLLDLRLQNFLQLVNFFQSLRIALLVPQLLLLSLLLNLLLDDNVVVLQITQRRLQLDGAFFGISHGRWDQLV